MTDFRSDLNLLTDRRDVPALQQSYAPSCRSDLTAAVELALTLPGESSNPALQELHLALKASQLQDAELVPIERNSVSTLQSLTDCGRAAIILLSSGVRIWDGETTPLPVGYPLADPPAECRAGLIAPSDGGLLLTIPRPSMAKLLSENLELQAALNNIIQMVHQRPAMPEAELNLVRAVRAQGIDALVTRAAIPLITGVGGILDILNPQRQEIPDPLNSRTADKKITVTQQIWALIRQVSQLTLHLNRDEVVKLAHQAALTASPEILQNDRERAYVALTRFQLMAHERRRSLLQEQFPETLRLIQESSFSSELQEIVLRRMLEVAWLNSRLAPKDDNSAVILDRRIAPNLSKILAHTNGVSHSALQLIDNWIEQLFDTLIRTEQPELPSIAVKRREACFALNDPSTVELGLAHPNHRALRDLAERLKEGERSAVGGSAYAAMRYPDTVLDGICHNKIIPLFFNGTGPEGIQDVRRRYGTHPFNGAVRIPCSEVRLQGAYGSFERILILFRGHSQPVMLTAHLGSARQLSNAGAVQSYRNGDNRRVKTDRIKLIDSGRDLQQEITTALHTAIRRWEEETARPEILGFPVSNVRDLPTQPIILLHPEQIADTFGDDVELYRYSAGALGPLHLAYLRNGTGFISRLVIPTVGGAGLYGDTAGMFVRSFFDRTLFPNIIPHLIFSATAGGFAGTGKLKQFIEAAVTGLSDVSPDGFLMPSDTICDDSGTLPMTTLINALHNGGVQLRPVLDNLSAALNQPWVHRYSRHYSISHPGDETYEKIGQLILQRMISSVDVEGGPIQRAILEIRSHFPHATFTPIYNFSDDPRRGAEDRHWQLAYGGPLHDNWKPDTRLNPLLKELVRASSAHYLARL